MKTFKEFLTESEVMQEIQITDIEQLLNSEYSEAYSNYLNGVVI